VLRLRAEFSGGLLELGGDRDLKLSVSCLSFRYVTCLDITSHNQGRVATIAYYIECRRVRHIPIRSVVKIYRYFFLVDYIVWILKFIFYTTQYI